MVYVDNLMNWGWRYGASCHMIADSVEELIEFAISIGLKERWIQLKRIPHFDLTSKRREQAIKAGAISLSRKEFVQKLREKPWQSEDNIHKIL
jgi:hypothetical protein